MAHQYVPASWIDDPCPRCGNNTLAVLRLVTEDGNFNHSRYVCLLYGKGRRSPCGWEGWNVPGWDEARSEQEAKRADVESYPEADRRRGIDESRAPEALA